MPRPLSFRTFTSHAVRPGATTSRSIAIAAMGATAALVVSGCGGSGTSAPSGFRSFTEKLGSNLTLHVALPTSFTVTGPTSKAGGWSDLDGVGPSSKAVPGAHVYVGWNAHPGVSPEQATSTLLSDESATPLTKAVSSPSVSGASQTHEIDVSYHGSQGIARAVEFAAQTSSGALVIVELVGLDKDTHFMPAQIVKSVSISHS